MATRRGSRIRRRTVKRMRGGNGEQIGRGSQGKVIKIGDEAVKTTDAKTALIERLAAEKLKVLDPEQIYTIYGSKFEEQPNKKWKISMKYAGKSLQPFEDAAWYATHHPGREIPKEVLSKLKALYGDKDKIEADFDRLAPFVKTLWKNGIIHKDIKFDNLVWDGERLYIIDWGEAIFEGDKDFAKNKDEDADSLETYKEDFIGAAAAVAGLVA